MHYFICLSSVFPALSSCINKHFTPNLGVFRFWLILPAIYRPHLWRENYWLGGHIKGRHLEILISSSEFPSSSQEFSWAFGYLQRFNAQAAIFPMLPFPYPDIWEMMSYKHRNSQLREQKAVLAGIYKRVSPLGQESDWWGEIAMKQHTHFLRRCTVLQYCKYSAVLTTKMKEILHSEVKTPRRLHKWRLMEEWKLGTFYAKTWNYGRI